MAVPVGAQLCQCRAGILHPHPGGIGRHIVLAQNHSCALFHRVGNETVTVDGISGNRRKKDAGRHRLGRMAHAGDLHIHGCVGFQYLNALQQRLQFHSFLLILIHI